jgi:hypothetical protein
MYCFGFNVGIGAGRNKGLSAFLGGGLIGDDENARPKTGRKAGIQAQI